MIVAMKLACGKQANKTKPSSWRPEGTTCWSWTGGSCQQPKVSRLMMEAVSSTQKSHAPKMVPNLWEQSWRQNIQTFASQTSQTLDVRASNHIWWSLKPSWSTLLHMQWWRWFPISQVERGPVVLIQLHLSTGFCTSTIHPENCMRKWHTDWISSKICCCLDSIPTFDDAMPCHAGQKPWVRPVGIGKIWHCLLAKLVVDQAGEQPKLACGSLQLFVGLEAGIKGMLHATQKWVQSTPGLDSRQCNQNRDDDSLFASQFSRESTFIGGATPSNNTSSSTVDSQPLNDSKGFTMVNAANRFNKLSHTAMLWTVRHLWPKGSQFAFNCYRHGAMLIVQNSVHSPLILCSCKTITQGDPMAMVPYGVELVPLVKILQQMFSDVMKPWYADDSATIGKHKAIWNC